MRCFRRRIERAQSRYCQNSHQEDKRRTRARKPVSAATYNRDPFYKSHGSPKPPRAVPQRDNHGSLPMPVSRGTLVVAYNRHYDLPEPAAPRRASVSTPATARVPLSPANAKPSTPL